MEQKTEPNGKKKYHRVERRSGSFSRSVWLPCAIDEERIEAELKDGCTHGETTQGESSPASQDRSERRFS